MQLHACTPTFYAKPNPMSGGAGAALIAIGLHPPAPPYIYDTGAKTTLHPFCTHSAPTTTQYSTWNLTKIPKNQAAQDWGVSATAARPIPGVGARHRGDGQAGEKNAYQGGGCLTSRPPTHRNGHPCAFLASGCPSGESSEDGRGVMVVQEARRLKSSARAVYGILSYAWTVEREPQQGGSAGQTTSRSVERNLGGSRQH